MPLAERVRRKIVPQRGFCSTAPGTLVSDALISGNGAMNIELMGDPFAEHILFHHQSLLMPWKRPLEAPNVADIFPQVRQLALEGKTRDAVALALQHMNNSPIKQDTEPHLTVPAFLMQLDSPKAAAVKDYVRTLNFENGEIQVAWTDEHGDWLRRTFASRPDNVIVQWLTAPAGQKVNVRISLQKSAEWSMRSGMDWGSHAGIGSSAPDRAAFTPGASGSPPKATPPRGVEACEVRQDSNEQRLIYKCRLDPSVDNSGYAGVVRVVPNGGSVRLDSDTLVVEGASSLMLLTRIEWFADYSEQKVDALRQAVEQIAVDYPGLLDRHQEVQSEVFNRVTVDFGGAPQYGMSTEELLADQRSRPDYSPALLEKTFQMGRHWFILTSGKYPSIAAEVNSTIDLQTAGAVQGNLREGMEAWFNWMESLAPDHRANAKNIFGMRGASYPLFPDKGIGVSHYYTGNTSIGIWPYWISAGGWRLRQFWDHYLVTGDTEFLRNRVVPAYKELALFYEDFLRRHRQKRELYLRPIHLARKHACQHGPVGPHADQRHHGYCRVPGSAHPFDPGRGDAGRRCRQRPEMEGDAGQDTALHAGTGRDSKGMGLAHAARALYPSTCLSSLRSLARRRYRSRSHAATGSSRRHRRSKAHVRCVGNGGGR
jgi:hypothetical protein